MAREIQPHVKDKVCSMRNKGFFDGLSFQVQGPNIKIELGREHDALQPRNVVKPVVSTKFPSSTACSGWRSLCYLFHCSISCLFSLRFC